MKNIKEESKNLATIIICILWFFGYNICMCFLPIQPDAGIIIITILGGFLNTIAIYRLLRPHI